MTDDYERLLSRSKQGDSEAFGALFERCARKIEARLLRQLPAPVRRKVSVQDVLQETMVTAHRLLPGFEDNGAGSFQSWLDEIAKNKARDLANPFLRTRKRRVSGEETASGRRPTDQYPGREPTPSQHAMAKEKGIELAAALASLGTEQREALRLTEEQDYSLAEAARIMGKSLAAMKKLRSRALARLARLVVES